MRVDSTHTVQKIVPSEPIYPELLHRISKPPEKLYFHGDLNHLKWPLLAIIGARDIKPWVLQWMENEVAPVLKKLKLGVVSGGARGVDQKAHQICIRCGHPTIVSIPSGLDRVYPPNIKHWKQNPNVSFLSEYKGDEEMRKHHFYHRNRIIVGMSPMTLVIQAREKSGSMMSARLAMDMGREVATLPGSPADMAFSGNNQLLYDGATMIRNRHDLESILRSELKISSNCDAKEKYLQVKE